MWISHDDPVDRKFNSVYLAKGKPIERDELPTFFFTSTCGTRFCRTRNETECNAGRRRVGRSYKWYNPPKWTIYGDGIRVAYSPNFWYVVYETETDKHGTVICETKRFGDCMGTGRLIRPSNRLNFKAVEVKIKKPPRYPCI